MASPDGPPPPVSNPITGTWRNSFADKDQKARALEKFDRVEELVCDPLKLWSNFYPFGMTSRFPFSLSLY
jgi:hypothetical protein